MRRSEPPPLTRGVVLRGVGVLVAVGLGALGIWLIQKGDTARHAQMGAFAEFWGLLIGAFAIIGGRRSVMDGPTDAERPAEPGRELALRASAFELERVEEAAARREYEDRLERMLRREIQTSVAREVTGLRDEIAQLRSELLEKVGGQLRLERIETTRVIGSDLEELQRELRELKHAARETVDPRRTETTSVSRIVEPARVRPVTREAAATEAQVQPARLRPDPAADSVDRVDLAKPEPVMREPVLPEPVLPAPVMPEPMMREPEPVMREPMMREPVMREPAKPEPVMREPARPEPLRPEPARPVADARPVAPAPFGPLPTAGIPSIPTPPAAPPSAPSAPTPSAPVAPPSAPSAPVTPAARVTPPPAAAAVPPPAAAAVPPPAAAAAPPPAPVAPPPAPIPTTASPPAAAPPTTAAAPPPAADPRPSPAPPADPAPDPFFADLPRIRPFTDFELDPIDDVPPYTGRRRRSGEEERAADPGRHSRSDGDGQEPAAGRRRAPESGDELLARLLARESARG